MKEAYADNDDEILQVDFDPKPKYNEIMPTILRVDGFKFFFFANDHPPMHVHVKKGDDYAKIDIVTGEVLENDMNQQDLRKVVEICMLNQDIIRRAWNEWFANR